MSRRLRWLRGRMIDVTDVQCFGLLRLVSFEHDMFNFGSMQTKAQTVMSRPIGHQSSDVVMSLLALCWLRLSLRVGRQTGANRRWSFPRIDRAVCKVTIKCCSLWEALIKVCGLFFYCVCLISGFAIRFLFLLLRGDFKCFLCAATTAITNACLAEFAVRQGFLTDLLPKP